MDMTGKKTLFDLVKIKYVHYVHDMFYSMYAFSYTDISL